MGAPRVTKKIKKRFCFKSYFFKCVKTLINAIPGVYFKTFKKY